jgi:hypothetical protein
MRKFNFLIPRERDRFLKLFLNSELLAAAQRLRTPYIPNSELLAAAQRLRTSPHP